MTGYYDYVLGLIPVSLLGISALLVAIGIPTTYAVPGGAVVAGGIIAHAMFVRQPIDRPAKARSEADNGGNRLAGDDSGVVGDGNGVSGRVARNNYPGD